MRPCISELLRTAHHPASLLLRVDRIVHQAVTGDTGQSGANQPSSITIPRLYLTDGQLIIQGLISPGLRFDVDEGDLLDIRRFEVRRAAKKTNRGHVLYLAIQDCDLIPYESRSPDLEQEEGGFFREASTSELVPALGTRKRNYSGMGGEQPRSALSPSLRPKLPPEASQPRQAQMTQVDHMPEPISSQSSDDFETTTPNAAATQKRRQALHLLNGDNSPYYNPSATTTKRSKRFSFAETSSSPTPTPRPATLPPPILPKPNLTPLASLPTLSPSKSIDTLAIITWTGQSLIRPSQAFPPKRHIKLHDLSIGSVFTGVTLANFIDAQSFKPARGTVVLLRGVVVQRCGTGGGDGTGKDGGLAEVSRSHMLNAYANLPAKLRERERERRVEAGIEGEGEDDDDELGWFVDDEDILTRLGLGAEVDELKAWWEEREARRTGGQGGVTG